MLHGAPMALNRALIFRLKFPLAYRGLFLAMGLYSNTKATSGGASGLSQMGCVVLGIISIPLQL